MQPYFSLAFILVAFQVQILYKLLTNERIYDKAIYKVTLFLLLPLLSLEISAFVIVKVTPLMISGIVLVD